jgi:hypothetical protein
MRSLGRLLKIAQNRELPLAALQALTELREELASLELDHVHNARQKGASWEDIAQALAISRQAVQQRFANGASRRKEEPQPGGSASLARAASGTVVQGESVREPLSGMSAASTVIRPQV